MKGKTAKVTVHCNRMQEGIITFTDTARAMSIMCRFSPLHSLLYERGPLYIRSEYSIFSVGWEVHAAPSPIFLRNAPYIFYILVGSTLQVPGSDQFPLLLYCAETKAGSGDVSKQNPLSTVGNSEMHCLAVLQVP